ncbi:Response regulator receiver domain-containing protein [Chitinophaga costaii]|uniref:Response regulator receiver domain-containing protein n=1 Tax=Chitinophaga costaii TaxID=1335309 RepID=A0A1C4E2Z4_9BACT|nr:response regulator [Chitinophaga costaii]PUZ24350.1 response regulator [Chitinophaga costaii]SCC37988.1 Response regulator receiver domain-containing protein [Chitinophaga costaii]
MNTITTCLIVDDDVDDQEIFSMAMKDIGRNYNFIFINNAIDALAQLVAGNILPQYIFLDLNMPRMNGLQCLENLRQIPALAQIPVAIYSTSEDHHNIEKSRALGATAFIIKHPTLPLLSQALDNFFIDQQNATKIA